MTTTTTPMTIKATLVVTIYQEVTVEVDEVYLGDPYGAATEAAIDALPDDLKKYRNSMDIDVEFPQ